MRWLNRVQLRLGRLMRRRQLERDLEDELRFHLDMLAADHPDPRRRFGNVTALKEACRELWIFGSVESWWQDLRYAVRMWRRNPAFTAVAVLTLTLAIGANTAIFSIIDGVIWRDLPYREPGRLAMVWSGVEAPASIPAFQAWKRQTRTFESLSCYAADNAIFIDPAGRWEPEVINFEGVANNFFDVLGVRPVLGRTFSDADTLPLAVLSHDFWLRRYQGSSRALGDNLELNGRSYRIVGVMPSGFRFPSKQTELWTPASASSWWPRFASNPERRAVVVFGRLQRGYSMLQAQAEMKTISARVVPLQQQILGRTVPFTLFVLLGAVAFVLLIACSNIANLLLARGASRQREFSLRTALGAGRARLIRQRFTESAVLALSGGLVGLVLAAWAIRAVVAFGPQDIPRLDEISISGRVLIYTFTISVLCAVAFGFPTGRTTVKRRRPVLVIAEFALAVMLLTGAGLLIRSLRAVQAVDPGFDARRVVTMAVHDRQSDDLRAQILDRIGAIPGVQSVGRINDIFLTHGGKSLGTESLEIEGHQPEPRDRWRPLVITPNSGDAFQAMGMRLLEGRLFNDHDGARDPLVVIINEAMARRFWSGEDPIGKRFKGYPGNDKDWVTVVGLVKDLRNTGLEKEAVSQMFAAPRQFKPGALLVVRSTEDPLRLVPAIRAVVHAMDPNAAISDISTLEQQLNGQFAQRRFQSYLLGLFSLMALVLAAVGVYGLLHYSVVQRTREIGIRTALGARPGDVVGMILREGLLLAVCGVALGLAGSFALARTLSSLLFGVTPTDPVTFIAVPLLLTAVALPACYIPARRATRVDPMIALRCE